MISSVANDTRFGTPGAGKKALQRPAKGRPCQEPDCTTLLSTYNASDHCFLHATPAYRHPLYRD
jgi:hypothetical protein